MNVPHRYGVVRALAFVLKLFAWVALAGGFLVAVVALVTTSNLTGAAASIVQFIRSLGVVMGPLVGIVWFVQLYAFGAILSLLVDIEENTRLLAAQPASLTAPVDVA
jgi:hypothetical protein